MNKLIIAFVLTTIAGNCTAQSLDRANLFNDHGLLDDSKRECIIIITSSSSDNDKAAAYYLLGSIDFQQNRISTALETWRTLTQKYPNSNEAIGITERISSLAQIVGESQKETIDNAIAQSYLRNADFWSRKKSDIFTIDSSWISSIDAAIKWYDKTISEFPKTPAARIAFEDKMKTIIGWEATGRYGEAAGIQANPKLYIPLLVSTFAQYEEQFPDSSALQNFRYQIAQSYWGTKDWAKTREWLNTIIEKETKGDSFYLDLAKRRLEHIEY